MTKKYKFQKSNSSNELNFFRNFDVLKGVYTNTIVV